MSDVIDVTQGYGTTAERVDVGEGHQILFMSDGKVRFAHDCDRHVRLGVGARVIRCAPELQIGHGHEVLSRDPLHIEASILCEDCGTHGWVRDGRWVTA